MAKLPHYTNSIPAMGRFEPFYPNLFEVTIMPPTAIPGGAILLEHVKSISGLQTEIGQGAVTQSFKQSQRSYAGTNVEKTFVDLTVAFTLNLNDSNEMYVYKTLRDWKRLIYHPLTGEMGIKKDYIGTMVVTQYNRKGDIFWTRTFYEVFPTGNIDAQPDLSYDNETPAELSVVFRADWWSDEMV